MSPWFSSRVDVDRDESHLRLGSRPDACLRCAVGRNVQKRKGVRSSELTRFRLIIGENEVVLFFRHEVQAQQCVEPVQAGQQVFYLVRLYSAAVLREPDVS